MFIAWTFWQWAAAHKKGDSMYPPPWWGKMLDVLPFKRFAYLYDLTWEPRPDDAP